MGILNENAIMGSSAVSGDFEIENSLRFNGDDSAKLVQGSFQPSSAYTISFWIKRGKLGTSQYIYRIGGSDYMAFTSSDTLEVERRTGSFTTAQVFRDPSAWYHIHLKSTSSVFTVYVNGVQAGTNTSASNPASAGDFAIGTASSSAYLDGYLAEFHWIDGSSLDPDSFGETGDYGEWKPIEYTGSHGSDGFYLDFADSSNLGNDASANSNNFTPTNLTASDQVKDSPTNNFCTMNNLDNYYYNATFSEGNLQVATTGGSGNEPSLTATYALRSGKWYWENYLVYEQSAQYGMVGITSRHGTASNDYIGKFADSYSYYSRGYSGGNLIVSGNYTAYGTATSYGVNDIIGCALDLDNNKMYWHKNGTYLNSGNPGSNSNGYSIDATPFSGDYYPSVGDFGNNNVTWNVNFGQDGTFAGNTSAGGNSDGEGIGNFKYSVPSGFKALCSKNLPDPTVIPSEHFNTVLYTGANGNTVTGVGFQPDMTWIKVRNQGYSHNLYDSVRGVTKKLNTDNNVQEETVSNGLTAFGSDGFTVGDHAGHGASGNTFVAWNWKMNGSGSSNSNGSITATVSANTTAGQSIMIYSGASGNGTVGHGLSVAPNLVIVKTRSDADQWRVGSIQSVDSMDFTDYLRLNDAGGKSDEATTWNDTAPTSTVISVGTDSATNHPGYTHVAYCFHDVEGYSKIGCYSGNGNSDGTFVYCGFRPQWLLIKPSNYGDWWKLFDTVRGAQNGPYNQYPPGDLKPNQHHSENFSTAFNFDFLSNGFKWRATDNSVNGGYNYLYYAIAEQPFKFSNAK